MKRWIAWSGVLVFVGVGFAFSRVAESSHPLERWGAWRAGAVSIDPEAGIRQRARSDCGPAALAYALERLGSPASRDSLMSEMAWRENGARFGDLATAARRRGFEAILRTETSRDPRAVSPPAILWLRPGHFVVLEAADPRGGSLIVDPALGRVRFSLAALRRHWRGHVLELAPPKGEES
ncbi:MAG: cysteine peptidase family C39 domain-containing protein [bacterium]